MTLTARQRQFLKGLAHPLAPVVRVGRAGVTEGVISETKKSLVVHELIKVRIDDENGDARKELTEALATAVGADVAARVGKIAVLYRAREEKPKIKLPG
jgi:RNA-binding protein